MAKTFHCPNCHAALDYEGGTAPTVRCQYCNSTVIVPAELRTTAHPEQPISNLSITQQQANLTEITRLLQAGNKIAAIKIYRETFNTGLKEAKDGVEAIEEGLALAEIVISPITTSNVIITRSTISRPLLGCIIAFVVLTVIGSILLVLIPIGGSLLFFQQAPELVPTQMGAVIFTPPLELNEMLTNVPTLFSGLGVTTPVATTSRSFKTFGTEGTGAGAFEDARNIAVDGQGLIYVGEYQGGRVQVFDPAGKFITQWFVDREFPMRSLAADRQGTVYVTQRGTIALYDGQTGEQAGELAIADYAFDQVAVMADGNIIGTTYYPSDHLVLFSADGEMLLEVEDVVSGQTGDSESIIVPASDGTGNFYLLAHNAQALLKYSPEGRFLDRFSPPPDDKDFFWTANDIAINQQGHVFVSNGLAVHIFNDNGAYLEAIPTLGVAFGISFNDQNQLIVAARDHVEIHPTE